MMEWINTLNKMYEENPCTDDGRVAVSYCEDLRVVVVKVFDNYNVIDIDDFSVDALFVAESGESVSPLSDAAVVGSDDEVMVVFWVVNRQRTTVNSPWVCGR